jgi:O-antigen/teichoic acid export membrane protein
VKINSAVSSPELDSAKRSTAGMTTKVVKGSFWTLIGQVLPMGVSLFATPFVIRFLGADGYGVLILVGLIPIYFSFADFGMSVASTKFASEAYGAGDKRKEAQVVRASAAVAFITSFPIAIGIFVFSSEIARVANVPDHYHSDAVKALRIMSVSFVITILSSVLNTPMLTRLRMDLNTLTGSLPKALMLMVTPVILYLGYGIVGAVWVVLVASLVIIAGQLYFGWRLLPEIFDLSIDKSLIRPLLKFGAGMVAAVIAVVVLQNLEKILLPALVSVKALAYYSVAFTFANMTSTFASSMVQSLIPAFSQLLGTDKKIEFDGLFSRAIRLNMIWIPPAIMILFVIARPFFTLWAGPDFGAESTLPFYVLLAGLTFNLVAYIPYSAITASGRTDVFAILYWVECAMFSLLTFSLIRSYGIAGAAAAWSIRMALDGFALMWLTKRVVGVTFNFTSHLGYLILGILLLSPPMIFAALYNNFSLLLVPMVFLFSLLYSLWIWNRLVNSDEKKWIKLRLAGVVKRKRLG